jgi:hypothetical protein
MTTTPPRNTQIRIDVVVREICSDGSVPDDDLRFVRFGEEVRPSGVGDFFQRSGHAMSLIFRNTFGVNAVSFVQVGPNKINMIKILRELGGYGLKEAKDLVEAPLGTTVLLVERNDLDYVMHKLQEGGSRVESRVASTYDQDNGQPRGTMVTPAVFARNHQ